MRIFPLLLLICSCNSKRELHPSDTSFDPNNRDWSQVYEHELNEALKNNDDEAYRFFWPEYLKELYKKKHNGVN